MNLAKSKTKKRYVRYANIACAVALFLDPVLNQAAIAPLTNMTPAQVHQEFAVDISRKAEQELSLADFRNPHIQYNPKNAVLDLQEMARIGMAMQKEYAFDAATIIPTDMPRNSSDQTYVAGKVLKHALEQWYKSSGSRLNEGVRTADAIGSGLSGSLTGDENSNVRIKIRPATGTAEIKYVGEFRAAVSYDAFDNEAKFEVAQNIAGKELVFNTINNGDGVINQVGVRWNF